MMSFHRKTYALSLLTGWILGGVGGTPFHLAANAQVTLPLAQKTTIAALEARAAHYLPGLLLTEVTKGSPAEQAGVKVGDLLLTLDGVQIRFNSQITPVRDQARWDGKRTVMLTVRRGAQTLQFSVTVASVLGITSQAPLPDAAQKLFAEANGLPFDQKAERLVKTQAAAAAAEQAGDARAAAWLWNDVYHNTPDVSTAQQEVLKNMLRLAITAGDGLLTAESLYNLGCIAYSRGTLEEAQNCFQRALALQEKLAPNSLNAAYILTNLGFVGAKRGKGEEVGAWYQRALTIEEKLIPSSLDVANLLLNLGVVADNRSKLEDAEQFFQRSLTLQEQLVPNSLDVALSPLLTS